VSQTPWICDQPGRRVSRSFPHPVIAIEAMTSAGSLSAWAAPIGQCGWMSESTENPVYGPLSRLVEAWCDRRELRPLAMVLPAYISNGGLTDGWADLMEALYDVRARGGLPPEEQSEVERLVPIVEQIVYRS
jgi:hypothetical protein